MQDLRDRIELILLAGGSSTESARQLADYLSVHYPDHAEILIAYVAPSEVLPPSVE